MQIAPGIATAMRVFSVLTILICSLTICMYLKYPKFQSKSLHTVIFYISICNVFNAIGVCIGLPKNGTFECYLQAILTNVFPLAAIFWTTAIAYMVFCIIYKAQKIRVNSKLLWVATFVLPVVLTLLPLSTETYGSPEEDDWCFVKERASSSSPSWTTLFWSIFCFYGWLYLNVLVYIVLLCVALRHIFVMRAALKGDSITLDKMEASLYKLIWYPLITLVVWLPAAVYDLTELNGDSSGRYSSNLSQYFAYLLPTTHGIFICCAFFATNTDVQLVLRELCGGRGLPNTSLLENLLAAERTSSVAYADRISEDVTPPPALASGSSSSSTSVLKSPTSPSAVKKKTPVITNPLGWTADEGDDVNYV